MTQANNNGEPCASNPFAIGRYGDNVPSSQPIEAERRIPLLPCMRENEPLIGSPVTLAGQFMGRADVDMERQCPTDQWTNVFGNGSGQVLAERVRISSFYA